MHRRDRFAQDQPGKQGDDGAKGTAELSNSRFATLVSAGETLMKIGKKDRAREVFLQARPIMEAAEVDPVNKKIVVESLAELGVE